MDKVGEKVQNFYNETPFPDYELERFNSKEDLKISAWPFSNILYMSIPENASLIDVGTGTGQLSALLSLKRKEVYGIDFSDSSLNKAIALKEKLKLDSLTLKKIDITDKEQVNSIGKKFDYMLCTGVLHHTGDAYGSFENIMKLVKPGGYVAIGLYNKYGRIPLKIRIFLAKTIFKNNNRIKDYFIKLQIGDVKDKERARGWWNDQYLHPHETTHTVGEVLKWFKKHNIEHIETLPSCKLSGSADSEVAGVWNETGEKYPKILVRFYKQLTWIWKTHKEGGYWVTFGKKRD